MGVDENGNATIDVSQSFTPTDLTGKYLERASVVFNPSTGEPTVSLQFNSEGSKLFEQITGDNVGKVVAIYLDGQPISAPVVREAISGGQAVISGNFTPQDAKELVGRLIPERFRYRFRFRPPRLSVRRLEVMRFMRVW